MAYKKIEKPVGDFWAPKAVNDELVGEVTKVEEQQYGKRWTICDEKGTETTTPSHKVLQNRMADIKVGDNVKIVYLGQLATKKIGQKPTEMYDVYKDE